MSVSITYAARQGFPVPQNLFVPADRSPEWGAGGPPMHFGADRPIYAEGDEAKSFYRVISGVVRTCQFLSDGRRQIDAFYLPGDIFGFEASTTHRLTAEAVNTCVIVPYRRRNIDAIIARDETIARQILAHAMSCLSQAREHCLLLGRGSAAQKIAAFLLEMADRSHAETIVELPMSRLDIADYLGLTIETVSRTLSQMEREGTIKLPSTRRVVLSDRDALEDLNA